MRFRPQLLLLMVLFAAGGCAWVGERDAESTAKMGGKLGRCLEGFGHTLRTYFEGRADREEVPRLLTCADRALGLFTRVVEPSRSGHYDLRDVQSFLRERFLGNDQVGNALFEEGMLLKKSVLGGTSDRLSPNEIQQTRRLLSVLKKIFRDLHPFAPFRGDQAGRWTGEEVEQLRVALHAAAQELGAFFDSRAQDYSFESMARLLAEFDRHYSLSNGASAIPPGSSMPGLIRDMLPLIQIFKDIFVARGADSIRPNQWTPLFLAGAKLLYTKLGSEHLKRRYEMWFGDAGFDFFKTYSKNLIADLKWSFSRRQRRDIPLTELDGFIRALKQRDLLPDTLGEQTAVDLMRPVFNTLLKIEGKQGVLAVEHVDAIWHQVERLIAGELYLRQLFLGLAEPGQNYREVRYDAAEVKSLGFSLPWPPAQLMGERDSLFPTLTPPELQNIGHQFNVISASWPLFQGSKHLVSFFRDHVHQYDGLASINVVRAMSQLILDAYGKESGGASITLPEWVMAFDDIKAFGVDMKFIDPRNLVTAQVRFSEGNLFLFSNPPNGEKVLDFYELVEMFAFMSSSIRLGRESHQEIVDSNKCKDMRPDIVNQIMVEEGCFRYYFFDKFVDRFRPVFPEIARYYEDLLDEKRWPNRAEMERRRLKFEIDVIHPDRTPGMIESVDTVAYVQVLNYVEALFTVFDKDQNGFLDDAETMDAFARFRSTLLMMLEVEVPKWQVFTFKLRPLKINDDTAKDLLRFFLQYGRKPEGTEFIQYVYGFGKEEIRADRGTLISLLAYLQFKNREIQERRLGTGS